MSIKLPATMVFYGESENRPHYLLWWIPPEAFPSLGLTTEALAEIRADYPNGIEIEVQDEALREVGLELSQWEISASGLREAFLQLHKDGNLPPTGMIQAEALIQLASALDSEGKKSIHEILSPGSQSFSLSSGTEAALETTSPLEEMPEMTSGEAAEEFFKRMSGL